MPCANLVNEADMSFMVPMGIGSTGQQLQFIPDSGSFSVVLASTMCSACGVGGHTLFDYDASSTYEASDGDGVSLAYGQGSVTCETGTDNVNLAGLTGNQVLLLMTDQSLDGFEYSAYDGVMGMGKNADSSGDDSDSQPAVLTTLGQDAFGVCVGQDLGVGQGGRLDLASNIGSLPYPYSSSSQLTTVGDYHWGLRISNVGINNASGITLMDGNNDYGFHPCDSGNNCAAIIDSGTSMLVGPWLHVEGILALVDQGGGVLSELMMESSCEATRSDGSRIIDELPSIVLTLGEERAQFELQPEMYMGSVGLSGASDLAAWKYLERRRKLPIEKLRQASSSCMPMFQYIEACSSQLECEMSTPQMTEHNGPLWILGLPMFRQFAIAFDRSSDPAKISLNTLTVGSNACASCSGSSEQEKLKSSSEKEGEQSHRLLPPGGQQRKPIDLQKLRRPSHSGKANETQAKVSQVDGKNVTIVRF